MFKKIKFLINYFQTEIWQLKFHPETGKGDFFLIRYLKILILSIKNFFSDACMLKASALTYYTLMSVVPVFALVFAIAKGFGFIDTVEAQLADYFSNQEEVMAWIKEFALTYLDNTKGGMIAGIGIVILIWSVMKVLGYIETSFNMIWKIKSDRSLVRKFSDYISFLLIAIVFLIASSGVMVFITNTINGISFLQIVGPLVGYAFPLILIWILFSSMYMIMVNTKVNLRSAIFGGMVAGTLFVVVQYFYIYFQVGVSKYNAIYGSFAALPLFLVWLQTSWTIVLFGAEVANSHQNENYYEIESQKISFFNKKIAIVMIVKYIVDNFNPDTGHFTLQQISKALRLPFAFVRITVNELVEVGILAKTVEYEKNENAFIPSYDINKMTISSILKKLSHHGDDFHSTVMSDDFENIKKYIEEFEKNDENIPENKLLKDIN